MRSEKIIDGLDQYIIIFQVMEPSSSELHVHSCWRFRAGRSAGEKVSITTAPWSVRQRIAEVTSDDSHL